MNADVSDCDRRNARFAGLCAGSGEDNRSTTAHRCVCRSSGIGGGNLKTGLSAPLALDDGNGGLCEDASGFVTGKAFETGIGCEADIDCDTGSEMGPERSSTSVALALLSESPGLVTLVKVSIAPRGIPPLAAVFVFLDTRLAALLVSLVAAARKDSSQSWTFKGTPTLTKVSRSHTFSIIIGSYFDGARFFFGLVGSPFASKS